MRNPMSLAVLLAVIVGCFPDEVIDPVDIDPGALEPHSGFFVSVDGSPTGDGSASNPWALGTALGHPGIVQPGDTIWLRGGTYRGEFTSLLTGTASAPVVLRQFPGERATIDGRLNINGQYAYYWGFEVMYSHPKRETTIAGSDPSDLPRERVTVYVMGPFNKLINLVVHDLGDGLFSGSQAQGLEIYGSIFYNNGWIGPDRGHGHGLYLQNQLTTKRVVNNVVFNSFSTGLKIGGTAAYLINFHVEGNAVFHSGAPALASFGYVADLDQAGGADAGNNTFDHNSFYHGHGGRAVRLGIGFDPIEPYPVTFTNNIVRGGIEFDTWPMLTFTGNKFLSPEPYDASGDRFILARIPSGASHTNYVVNNNSYSYPAASMVGPFHLRENGVGTDYTTIAAWRTGTGWDINSPLTSDPFTGMDIVIRPNRFEAGRANVIVWNWDNASSADINPSGILNAGDKYTVHHVYDLFGAPVAAGTYSGGRITVPLRNYSSPIPIGMTAAPPSPGSRFGVFIIRRS
jgi:hypothetical protein